MGQYIHFGDAIIFIASCLLPFPLGPIAGLLGGALADILTGYSFWAPFTAIIKFVMVLPFSSKSLNILSKTNFLKVLLAETISTVGYFLSTIAVIYFGLGQYSNAKTGIKDLIYFAAVDSILSSLIQSLISIVAFCIFAKTLDKINIKKYIER